MGVVLGLCFGVVFAGTARTKHFAEVDGGTLRFGRKGREVRELLLSDVSSATFSEGSMVVERDGETFSVDSAGDDESLRRFVEELQKAY